jgi:ubiquinone/menaquinone biosynthesis C-methylase UbiE
MKFPAAWTDIGRHGVLPEASHDEVARFNVIANLNAFLAQRVAPTVGTAFERRARPAWRLRHGRDPADRHDVHDAIARDPAYRAWSALRRNTMEMRQQAGRSLVLRQSRELKDRVDALNAGSDRLRLDPSLPIPRYVASVDVHLMPGGYTGGADDAEVMNPANYDAGFFATVGGSGGPWNDGAGRALVAWLRANHPQFRPLRIVDLGCGLGHNTLPLRGAFPDAEIIAIDVAAPMLRYGHARARSMGIEDVNFWQQDATRTSLEAGSCDFVFTSMVLHETSREALPRLFAEARRLLRPGGLTIHLEQPPFHGLEPFEQFMRDWDGRYNNEPFWSALHETSLPALLREAGFAAHAVFESRCVAPACGAADARPAANEDFGRAPQWYAAGAWQDAAPVSLTTTPSD